VFAGGLGNRGVGKRRAPIVEHSLETTASEMRLRQVFGYLGQTEFHRGEKQNLESRAESVAQRIIYRRALKQGPSPSILSLTGRGTKRSRDSSPSATLRASAGGTGLSGRALE
jgi:hypothetical protein